MEYLRRTGFTCDPGAVAFGGSVSQSSLRKTLRDCSGLIRRDAQLPSEFAGWRKGTITYLPVCRSDCEFFPGLAAVAMYDVRADLSWGCAIDLTHQHGPSIRSCAAGDALDLLLAT